MSDTPKERSAFGSLILRGRIWTLRYHVGGKAIWESLRTTSRDVAVRKAAVIADRVGRGEHQTPNERRLTFADLEKMILDHYKVEGLRSRRRVTSALPHLRETFGTMRVNAITSANVTSYKAARLDEGASMSTANYELSVLRKAMNLAVDAGRLAKVPSISTPKVDNARTGFFEADDFAAVLKHLPPHVGAVMRFAYYTGWRVPSEVLTLTWDRVDFDSGLVRLDAAQTKTKKPRLFPFAELPELATLLEDQRAATTALERQRGAIIPFVFHHRGGRAIVSYYGAWRAACALAATGGKKGPVAEVVRPRVLGRIAHDFRRTAVRNLVRSGVDELTAMRITGHTTREVFDRYNIGDESDLRAAVAKLNEHLHPKGKKGGRVAKVQQSGLKVVQGAAS
jgi:integrase